MKGMSALRYWDAMAGAIASSVWNSMTSSLVIVYTFTNRIAKYGLPGKSIVGRLGSWKP